jgi:hypothetical protein
MTTGDNRLLGMLMQIYNDALSTLSQGDVAECLRVLAAPYSHDALLLRHDIMTEVDFASAISELAGGVDFQTAIISLNDELLRTKQCQLHLLKAVAHLERGANDKCIEAVAAALEDCIFLNDDNDESLERVVKAVLALNANCALTSSRLWIWLARRHVNNGKWSKARDALDHVSLDDVGPFKQSLLHLRGELSKHLGS